MMAFTTLEAHGQDGKLILPRSTSPWNSLMMMTRMRISEDNETAYKTALTANDWEIIAADAHLTVSIRGSLLD
jgi:hypothetical protein